MTAAKTCSLVMTTFSCSWFHELNRGVLGVACMLIEHLDEISWFVYYDDLEGQTGDFESDSGPDWKPVELSWPEPE